VGVGAVLEPVVPIQSVQAVRDKAQNGIGIGKPGDQMFTLTGRDQHAVAFAAENSRAEFRLEGGDGQVVSSLKTGGGKPGQSYPAIAFGWQNSASQGDSVSEHITPSLAKSKTPAVAFTCSEQANGFAWERPIYPTLNAQIPNDTSNIQMGVRQGSAVRRLTPRECERLQGFPDDYTLIPWREKEAPDGPRYKALGNSMAVPVMRWIGERIEAVSWLEAVSRLEAAE
jgi:DNA (cytosine-5)-methyltransferase 1